jgi:hypothetical protein
MREVLVAAIVGAALVIGLLAGFPLGTIARNFYAAPSSSDEITLPQQE